jgi:hypothetical protein
LQSKYGKAAKKTANVTAFVAAAGGILFSPYKRLVFLKKECRIRNK